MMASNNQQQQHLIKCYEDDLQGRLRNLSLRTNCPTRQENGQRYLGPPVNWTGKPPANSEVFISKLPIDCFEDEIYDFCSQVGKVYLIRLMINFENENRGFCFVTFSNSKEATMAVTLLPQKLLRKGHYVHAEISLNNCTLKMYGLDYRWNDDDLEQEIRVNTKDVVNVTIKRNMAHRTLMATLYFDTHQKAAIARRKLSQIANSRWGQNVKVFLWSKKLQNRIPNKQALTNDKQVIKNENEYVMKENSWPSTANIESSTDPCISPVEKENVFKSKNIATVNYKLQQWIQKSKFHQNDDQNLSFLTDNFSLKGKQESTNNLFVKYSSCDLNNNTAFDMYDTEDTYDPFTPSCNSPTANIRQYSSPINYCNLDLEDHSQLPVFPLSNESSPARSKSSLSDIDPNLNWNNPGMHTKLERSLLDLRSPFDHTPEIYRNLTETCFQDKQIEIILKEALETLTNINLNQI